MGTGRIGANRVQRNNTTSATGSTETTEGYYASTIKHDGTHTYPDDNGKTARDVLAISNNDELIRQITKDSGARQAFEDWASGRLMGASREDYQDLSLSRQIIIKNLDKYIDKSELYQGIQVHSLGGASVLTGQDRYFVPQNLDAYIGNTIQFKTQISTAVAADGLSIGKDVGIGRGKNVDYVFNIPPGKGAGMWIGDTRINGWGDRQREFILNRDTVWKVTGYKKVTYKESGGWGGGSHNREIWQVQLEYVGRERHKY